MTFQFICTMGNDEIWVFLVGSDFDEIKTCHVSYALDHFTCIFCSTLNVLAYKNNYIKINAVSYAHTHTFDYLKGINEPVNTESRESFILCLCYSAQK